MKLNFRWSAWLTVITVGSLVACNGGGTNTTPLTPAGGGSRSGQAVHTNGLTTFQSINAGGGAVSPFSADADYSGGQTASTTAAVNTNVENAAPQAVYQTNRYGTFSYSLSGESPGAPYIVRLHFAEFKFNAAGARQFNIAINSTTVLSNFDIYAAAGGMDKAVVEQFPVNASSSGVISIGFTRVKEQPEVSGIEIVRENLLTGAPVDIAAGNGSAVSNFSADNDFNGGYTEYDASHKIDTSAVSNPPPPGVFYGQRIGTSFRYVFTGLTPNSSYNLRLDFMERYFDAPKQRVFNVAVNGNQFLTNYDIFADAGAMYKATAKSVTVNADRSGNITVVFTAVVNVAKVNGLELSAATTATPPPYSSKIQHVVVIIQENRSFDNLFYGFPGADTAQSGINSQGRTIPLAPVTLEAHHDPAHNHTTFVTQYDGGKNDAFDKGGFDFFPTTAPNYEYAYVPHSETADYFSLGEKYTVGDRMFTSNSGPSYVSHQYLIAGQSANVAEVPSHTPWGCDAPSGTTTTLLNNKGQEVPGPFPCFNYQTLGDLMDAKSVTWAYYAPAYSVGPSGYIWSAYDAIKHIRYGSDWTSNVISPETTVLSDIQNNKLRQVSYVVPDFANSDHAIAGSNTGPAWVSSIVDALGSSKYWPNTAVFIMWDDWGGWYDHVVPQQLDVEGLGFRVPLIVVSPYAKHGYVSHVQHEFGSVLKFIEETYNLGSLGTVDVRSDDMNDIFNLSQPVTPLSKLRTDVQMQNNIQRFLRESPSMRQPDDE